MKGRESLTLDSAVALNSSVASASRAERFLKWALASFLLCALCAGTQAKGKTVYVHPLDGDDVRGDGSYAKPYKSWRAARGRRSGAAEGRYDAKGR